jgi:predicted kinase
MIRIEVTGDVQHEQGTQYGGYGPAQPQYAAARIIDEDGAVHVGRVWRDGGDVRLYDGKGERLDVPPQLTGEQVWHLFRNVEKRQEWQADPTSWPAPCRCWPSWPQCGRCARDAVSYLADRARASVAAAEARAVNDLCRHALLDYVRDGWSGDELADRVWTAVETAPIPWRERGVAAYLAWAQTRTDNGAPTDAGDGFGAEACAVILNAVADAGRRVAGDRTLTVTRGLPGCGKSTWARQAVAEQPDRRALLNLDRFREMLFGGRTGAAHHEKAVVQARDQALRGLLADGWDVIVDDTNLPDRAVTHLRAIALECGAAFEVRDMRDTPLQTCIDRNNGRSGTERVPEDVIRRMHSQHIAPRGRR